LANIRIFSEFRKPCGGNKKERKELMKVKIP
jgi:hypothetical protein